MKKIYISGPMTGLPDNNFPAFKAAKELLESREKAAIVISPHEIEIDFRFGDELTWENYLKADLKELLESDMVVILPGWQNSKGAMLEIHVAHSLSIPIVQIEYFQKD